MEVVVVVPAAAEVGRLVGQTARRDETAVGGLVGERVLALAGQPLLELGRKALAQAARHGLLAELVGDQGEPSDGPHLLARAVRVRHEHQLLLVR